MREVPVSNVVKVVQKFGIVVARVNVSQVYVPESLAKLLIDDLPLLLAHGQVGLLVEKIRYSEYRVGIVIANSRYGISLIYEEHDYWPETCLFVIPFFNFVGKDRAFPIVLAAFSQFLGWSLCDVGSTDIYGGFGLKLSERDLQYPEKVIMYLLYGASDTVFWSFSLSKIGRYIADRVKDILDLTALFCTVYKALFDVALSFGHITFYPLIVRGYGTTFSSYFASIVYHVTEPLAGTLSEQTIAKYCSHPPAREEWRVTIVEDGDKTRLEVMRKEDIVYTITLPFNYTELERKTLEEVLSYI